MDGRRRAHCHGCRRTHVLACSNRQRTRCFIPLYPRRLTYTHTSVFAFGSGQYGQLGNGRTGEHIVSAGKSGFDIKDEPGPLVFIASFCTRSRFMVSARQRPRGQEDRPNIVRTAAQRRTRRRRVRAYSSDNLHFLTIFLVLSTSGDTMAIAVSALAISRTYSCQRFTQTYASLSLFFNRDNANKGMCSLRARRWS